MVEKKYAVIVIVVYEGATVHEFNTLAKARKQFKEEDSNMVQVLLVRIFDSKG